MKYIKENKKLLLVYLYTIISNILISIFTSFYLRNSQYKDLIMFLIVAIVDYIIYHYNCLNKYKVYLDFGCNFIVGLILLLFTNDLFDYGTLLFSIFFANNIIFIKSRLNEKFLIKTLQYALILLYTMICMFINMAIFNFL